MSKRRDGDVSEGADRRLNHPELLVRCLQRCEKERDSPRIHDGSVSLLGPMREAAGTEEEELSQTRWGVRWQTAREKRRQDPHEPSEDNGSLLDEIRVR